MVGKKMRDFITKYRMDIIVIASFLVLAVAVLVVINLTKNEGAYAEAVIDGDVVGKYPLAVDGVYSLNGGTNTLTVKDGVAYMSFSDCPDHTCEIAGKVKHVGQTIVCLPNHLTITIIGESDDSVDFVS